jgi:hypothetical protein
MCWLLVFLRLSVFHPDQKAADLLAAIGLPADTQFAFKEFPLTLDPGKGPYGAAVINSTPESSDMLLPGLGLVKLGVWDRRTFQRVKV